MTIATLFRHGPNTAHALGSREQRQPANHAYLPRREIRGERQLLSAGPVNSSHIDGRPPRNVVTTTVKAISGRIYSKSGRELREEPSDGRNIAQRVLSLALAPLHDKQRKHKIQDRQLAQHSTAQTLPDDVLLEIFNCHRQAATEDSPWKWHRLAQVCRRWRSVVFAYPRHLELRIVLTYNKPVRNAPTFWPVLPVAIWYPHAQTASHPILTPSDEDNISDILKNPARICEIDLDITPSMLVKFALSLRESFPALDHLRLRSRDSTYTIVLPDEFLDGSAPRLRVLHLKFIAIPMLPRILSSSKNLISLRLEDLTLHGYFTAEDLAIGLSTATQLKSLVLAFLSETNPSLSPKGPSPLSSDFTLPSLTEFQYKGDGWFLREFLSRINAPMIEQISVSFFWDAAYGTRELCELFGLEDALKSSHCLTTHIHLSRYQMDFSHHFARIPSSPRLFRLQLPYHTIPPSPLLAQVCLGLDSQDLLPKVIHLKIDGCPEHFRRDPACWLDLFRTLAGLKTLHVIGELGSRIAFALAQVTGETVREIMPALQELHFGPEAPSSTPAFIRPFITMRQLYGLPVSVHFKKLNWAGGRWGDERE